MSKLPDPAAADRLDRLVKRALAEGADAADAVEFKNISVGVSYRLGQARGCRPLGILRSWASRFRRPSGRVRVLDRFFRRARWRAAGDARSPWPGSRRRTSLPVSRPAIGWRRNIPELEIDDPAGAFHRASGRARARRRSGRARGSRHHQFRGRQRRLRAHDGDARDLRRLPRRLCRAPAAAFRSRSSPAKAPSMERDYDYAHTRFADDLESAERHRQARRRARGEAAQSAQGPHAIGAGVLRSARRGFPGRPLLRRDIGRGDRARRELPQGQDGPAGVRREHLDHRRSAPQARAADPSPSTAKASPIAAPCSSTRDG